MLGWIRRAILARPEPEEALPPAPTKAPHRAEVGAVLSQRYRLDRMLGKGGAGAVYRAWDGVLGQTVALKILHHHPTGNPFDTDTRAGLRREAVASMKLSHPGIARVHTYDNDGPVDYLVMEFIDGATLGRCRTRRETRRLPLGVLTRVMLDTLDALGFAHRMGVVHNDITPANIMITPGGQVKLLDFGLAWARGQADHDDAIRGTVAYMCPERLQGLPSDHRSDLYSLGAVFFTAASGEHPFGDKLPVAAQRHLQDPVPESEHIPFALATVIRRAMAKRPEDRFASADEMASTLRAAIAATHIRLPDDAASALDLSALSDQMLVEDPSTLSQGGINYVMLDEVPTGDQPIVPPLVRPPVPDATDVVLVDDEDPEDLGTLAPAPVADDMVRLGGRLVVEDKARVEVDTFDMDRFPVTNADYAEFVANTRALPPAWWGGRQPPEDKRTHPVVGVTIAQARAYAEWRGKRLPTTLEWVAAARGSDNTLMPWGESCVDKACHCPRNRPRTTAPVDAHPAGRSGEGVQDLIGNVWEWTERHDALLPDDADYHFVMGGSFKHRCTFPSQLPRTAVSKHGEYLYLGFRCARDPGVSNA